MYSQSIALQLGTNASRMQANTEFELLLIRGLRHCYLSRFIGSRDQLLNLEEIQKQLTIQSRNPAGIRLVPIAAICGSEGRSSDFDAKFRPLKRHCEERWVSIALAHQLEVGLPAVELIQINDRYFVRDGHHRISVARWLGQLEIEAHVTVWHVNQPDGMHA